MTTHIPSLTLPRAIFETPAVSILVPVGVGLGVGYASRPRQNQDSYLALKQPPFLPPASVFPPVWTSLYAGMGYAAYRAWTSGIGSQYPIVVDWTRHGATLYTIQLALNFAWMPLYFYFKRPVLASIDIVALTGVTGYMTYLWGKVDKVAGYALAPYCAWLGLATYLCVGSGYLNDWNFHDKERAVPPSMKNKDTTYVNEKDD